MIHRAQSMGVAPPAVSQGQLSGIEWVPMCRGATYSGDVAVIEAQIPASLVTAVPPSPEDE